jgi:hypothetical protein
LRNDIAVGRYNLTLLKFELSPLSIENVVVGQERGKLHGGYDRMYHEYDIPTFLRRQGQTEMP